MLNDLLNDSSDDSSSAAGATEFEALQKVIGALRELSSEARRRILESASLFLQVGTVRTAAPLPNRTDAYSSPASRSPFSEDTSMSAKEFLLDKQPKTDVERIACLAYYLTHYRATPHFKTVDISLLNTEAAQPKFANTAYSVNNAVKMGYLVPSTKGQRQISA